MINYVQNGSRIDITTPYAVSSGGGCLVGTALFGIAVDTYGSAAAGVIATEGVFDIAKETGPSFAVGARCWWNDTTKVVTTSGTASALEVGIATSTAGTAATTARVKLHQKIQALFGGVVDWASHMQRILARLGEDVTCTPSGGSPVTVRGVFLKPFHSLDGGLIESSDPGVAGLTSDLAGMKHGDPVVRAGTTYTVQGIEPDGVSGLTTLRLKT